MNRPTLKHYGIIAIIAGALSLAFIKPTTAAAPQEDITEITLDNFSELVTKGSLPVVIDAYATWCGPCQRMKPVFDRVSEQFSKSVRFMKMDVDVNQKLMDEFSVSSMPTLLFFREGKLVGRHVGLVSEADLRTLVHQYCL